MKIEKGRNGMMNKTRLDYAARLWVFYFFGYCFGKCSSVFRTVL